MGSGNLQNIDTKKTSSKNADLAVVIVSYNTCQLTLKCIASIINHSDKLQIEIIVVDNDSSDDSVHQIKTNYPSVTLIDNNENIGFGRANNIGFEYCKADYVLVLNPDTEIQPGCLSTCVNYLKQNPTVGVLGCKVYFESGQQQSTLFRFLSFRELFFSIFLPYGVRKSSTVFGDERYASLDHNKEQQVEVVAGCFMMLPIQVVEQTNGFNPKFFMYSEEAEWCYRIQQLGYTIHYIPHAAIMHHGAASSEHLTAWKLIEMARGKITFMREIRGKSTAYMANFLMLIGTFPKLLLAALTNHRNKKFIPMLKKLQFHLKYLFNFE